LQKWIRDCSGEIKGSCNGKPAETADSLASFSEHLDEQIPRWMDRYGVPGVSMALIIDGEPALGYVKDLSPMDSGGWGSDYVEITLSPLFNFALSESSAFTILFQFRRERLYSEPSIFANYFRNRAAIGAYWDFYRIALSYNQIL